MEKSRLRLIALTPGAGSETEVLATIDRALADGATAIWLRERHRTVSSIRDLAFEARTRTRQHGAALLVAGDAELAQTVGADAVHLGFRDDRPEVVRKRLGSSCSIGFSAHDPLDLPAITASDYVTLSPFAATPKEGSPSTPPSKPLTPERFAELRRTIHLPVVALGGIDEENAALALGSGADGIAVRRAVDRLSRLAAIVRRS